MMGAKPLETTWDEPKPPPCPISSRVDASREDDTRLANKSYNHIAIVSI